MLARRREMTQKFLTGEWGVELEGFEEGRETDRRKEAERAREASFACALDVALVVRECGSVFRH